MLSNSEMLNVVQLLVFLFMVVKQLNQHRMVWLLEGCIVFGPCKNRFKYIFELVDIFELKINKHSLPFGCGTQFP
jgi:hypothetical protein